jgi:hypothetical protein
MTNNWEYRIVGIKCTIQVPTFIKQLCLHSFFDNAFFLKVINNRHEALFPQPLTRDAPNRRVLAILGTFLQVVSRQVCARRNVHHVPLKPCRVQVLQVIHNFLKVKQEILIFVAPIEAMFTLSHTLLGRANGCSGGCWSLISCKLGSHRPASLRGPHLELVPRANRGVGSRVVVFTRQLAEATVA